MLKFTIFVLTAVLATGCATDMGMQISLNAKRIKDEAEIERFYKAVQAVKERNSMIEDSPEWLKEAYSSLKIRRLNDIPEEEYGQYKKYLYRDEVYIIVHPAFFVFFENERKLSSKRDKEVYPTQNIVERFFDKYYAYDYSMTVMKEQERLLRDFTEVVSMERKLVILILPKDYREHLSYGYIEGLDEYARYINEITNMSESVVYMKTSDPYYGYMADGDLKTLKAFIEAVGAKSIMVGGGYIGRCLTQFYSSIEKEFDRVYMVPEISAVSPIDLNNKWGRNILTRSGRIDFRVVAGGIKANAYGNPSVLPPDIRPLLYYRFYSRK